MLKEKIQNTKTTNWLAEGLTDTEINSIKELAVISAKIEMKRNELGMNQKEFAKMMGVSQGMVSKWESGEYNFTIATLKDICSKLDLEFEPIIREKNYSLKDEYKIIDISRNKRKNAIDGWTIMDLSKRTEVIA